MRFIKQGYVRNPTTGIVISGATVTVYLAGTTTLATIYTASSGGSAISGSQVTSDSNGYYKFYVDNTVYNSYQLFDMLVQGSGLTAKTYYNVDIIDNATDSGDIRNFGALGDGSTDDTTAIQNAFNTGRPSIPDGTWLVSGITVVDNTKITASRNATLKFISTATPAPIITCTGDKITLVGGLTLNGNSTATNGWYHNGANNATIDSLYITGCTSHGLSVLGVSGNGAYYNNWYNLISKSNGGSGVKIDGNENPSSRANVNNFFGGQISSNTGDGFTLTNCKGILVDGIDVETNGGWAYNLTTCVNQALTVKAGWVESNTTGGVNVDATTRGVQFWGTRFNQSTPFSGAGIDNQGNVFMVDDATGVLTKWMELNGASFRNVYLRNAINDTLNAAGTNTLQTKASGDSNYRFQLNNSGSMYWGTGSGASDVNMIRNNAGLIVSTKISATGGLGVGNSASATTLGSVTKKIQIFDTVGNSLGYLPVYDAIT